MVKFFVNGTETECGANKGLMDFLRDDLRLTSVKNGCAQGACGACTVLLDGRARKACVLKTDRLEGKHVVTVEGLSVREAEVYAHAFAVAGAVQCGFCTPGMVLCAKALLDAVPDPDEEQVRRAIKHNLCRCTGYKKIEKAILLVGRMLRENLAVVQTTDGKIGSPMPRVDARSKVLGVAEYVDDMVLPGMVYGGAVRSRYPRAKVIKIDMEAAKKHAGFVAAVTAEDVPGAKNIGHLKKDWPVLVGVGQVTHYLGDAIVLVAAKTKQDLAEIRKLVEVEQEEMPPVVSPQDAMRKDAPKLHEGGNVLAHEHLVRGNADEKIGQAKYVVTQRYKTPFTEHAFLEPECAVALPEGNGIRIYSADQGVYQTRKECAEMLGVDMENVRVTAKTVGGGFGGKEDMSVQHHAALLAYYARLPVKFLLSRQESIVVHPKRHPMEMEFTTACDEHGNLTAMKAVIISDTGAYASLGGPVLQRACTHAAGPYHYQDIDIEGTAVYTNNPPAGAYRGFGVTQSCFAMESNLNRLAELAGLSPFEIRYKNAIRPGEVLPNGQIADESTALVETLEAVREVYENSKYAGIACAFKNSGLGVGIPDVGRCRIVVLDGMAHICSSAACIGQGLATVLIQIVCDAAGLSVALVVHDDPDTKEVPDAGNTTASRQTLFTGEAARRAAIQLAEDLHSGKTLAELEGNVYDGEYAGVTDRLGEDKQNPVSHVAYGYATHVVTLGEDGRIEKVVAAHDVGTPINPLSLEGQIEGGVTMSLGYALTEEYLLQNCVPMAKYGTLGLLKSTDTPQIEAVLLGKGVDGPACGAKGIGEICSIPTAPAVALAYEKYDGIIRTELPLAGTPYK